VRLDLAEPEPANSVAILFRQVRYGFFNPQRDGLVDDPWRWRWSTLRDLGGACLPAWMELPRVAQTLELPPPRALRRLTTIGDFRAPALESKSLAAALGCGTVERARGQRVEGLDADRDADPATLESTLQSRPRAVGQDCVTRLTG
jgi:hypothetical protein